MLQVAGELFYDNGIRATGVDHVAAEAGVAPTTLYRVFESKDGLVSAYVERMHHDFQQVCEAAVAAAGSDPREQILTIFDVVFAEVSSAHYRGCPMLKTLAEFPDPELPAHRNAVAAKSWLRQTLGELTAQLGGADSPALADQLMLVLDGMHATGQSLGPDGPAKHARHLAEALLSAAAPRPDAA